MNTTVITNASITTNVLPGHLRSGALPKRFPGLFLIYEMTTYNYMGKFAESYSGGYWEYINLSNGGFYMSLKSTARFRLTVDSNGFVGEMSADGASLVANLYTLCHLANQHKLDHLIQMYHALRDYAVEHPEAGLILGAID